MSEVLLVKGATIVLALWGLAALDPDQPGGLGYIADAFRVGVSVNPSRSPEGWAI